MDVDITNSKVRAHWSFRHLQSHAKLVKNRLAWFEDGGSYVTIRQFEAMKLNDSRKRGDESKLKFVSARDWVVEYGSTSKFLTG